ncbi:MULTISPECIES: YopX family protein [unclassified Streptococcus]|uniref:YopX family protein n=1 Tax=unclassified Streptococcus TaxID=2608887 RepID=UPI00211B2F3A|nr:MULTISPECIES: YopX family protein [unclassified Streptococcus]MCQ9211640.1 YopX family protein [Streptococcus sp. B01]MCQ9213157.1 YopX family protein [Streptococcus sp. O1]MCQ9214945.1 YopX family protein [Streptococcus sp. O1]MCQ9215079.1 YopX family protein [Streptococcus sp. O1]
MIPKFRAWDTFHNKWVKHFYITENGLIYNMEQQHRNLIGAVPIEKSGLVVMQSTGQFDKNGVEIFEGDVVLEDGWRKVIVSFGTQEIEENFGDIRIFQGFNLDLGCGYPTAIKSSFEVLGNIYENLNLLEENNV